MLEEQIQLIFDYASDNGLKDVEIRIGTGETDLRVVLWVNGKDRIDCNSIAQLDKSIREHDNLNWMQ